MLHQSLLLLLLLSLLTLPLCPHSMAPSVTQCEKLGQTIIFVRTRETARSLHAVVSPRAAPRVCPAAHSHGWLAGRRRAAGRAPAAPSALPCTHACRTLAPRLPPPHTTSADGAGGAQVHVHRGRHGQAGARQGGARVPVSQLLPGGWLGGSLAGWLGTSNRCGLSRRGSRRGAIQFNAGLPPLPQTTLSLPPTRPRPRPRVCAARAPPRS